MPIISINEALKKINCGDIAPVYFLFGKEKFFHDQIIQKLTETIFPDKAGKDLNLTVLYGFENSLGEVISTASSLPMLSKQKMVLVRDFIKMKISDPDALSKYLEHPRKSACLVLSSEEKGRAKIYKTIQDLAQSIECKPIPEYQAGGWIKDRVKQKGSAIEMQAVQFIVNQVGTSLLNLDQELNKIINFKNDNTTITIDDLEQTTGISRDASVFALQNALARRQLGASLKVSKRLLDAGQNIISINAVLFAFFKKMLIAASLKQRGNNRRQIAEQMKLGDFQLKEIFETMNNFSVKQIESIIALLHQTDIEAKTSAVLDEPGLQMLCYKICAI
jgi:DNA polymerase-3 subunit delta